MGRGTRFAVIALAAFALSGCGSGGDGASRSAIEATSCKDLIPEVIDVSEDSSGDDTIVAIYKPTLVADHIAEFNAGTYKIPAGKNSVPLLQCKGEAAWSDNEAEVPITFEMTVDTDGATFIAYEEVG